MDTAKDTAELKRTDENLETRMNIIAIQIAIASYRERSRANRASMRTKLCHHASYGSEGQRKGKVWWIFSNY